MSRFWNTNKHILSPALALCVIAVAVTAALSCVNLLTATRIDALTEQEETSARQRVINADSFEKHTVLADGGEVVYYKAFRSGAHTGYVFTAETAGKSSGLVVMTGIDASGKITGVTVTQDNETAGYVEKVHKQGFFTRFSDNSGTSKFVMGENIDGVSQATLTSTGITKGVNMTLAYYNMVREKGE